MGISNAEKAAYLNRYRESLIKEKSIKDEIDEIMTRAYKITPSLSLVPGNSGDGSSSGNKKIESAIEKANEVRKRLEAQMAESEALREKIESIINSVSPPSSQNILRLRYINGMSLKKISATIYLDYRWVRRKHQAALRRLKIQDISQF